MFFQYPTNLRPVSPIEEIKPINIMDLTLKKIITVYYIGKIIKR